jgi:hypothetical protein
MDRAGVLVPSVADASGAPVPRDQGPDRPGGYGKADDGRVGCTSWPIRLGRFPRNFAEILA